MRICTQCTRSQRSFKKAKELKKKEKNKITTRRSVRDPNKMGNMPNTNEAHERTLCWERVFGMRDDDNVDQENVQQSEKKEKWEKVDRTCSTAALYSKCFTSKPYNKISLYPTTGYTPLSNEMMYWTKRAMEITEHKNKLKWTEKKGKTTTNAHETQCSLSLLQ